MTSTCTVGFITHHLWCCCGSEQWEVVCRLILTPPLCSLLLSLNIDIVPRYSLMSELPVCGWDTYNTVENRSMLITVFIGFLITNNIHWIHLFPLNFSSACSLLQGNKGGVSARMSVYGHTICFLNCHLPAHMENSDQRMEDFESILQQQQFEGQAATGVLDHEYVSSQKHRNFRLMYKLWPKVRRYLFALSRRSIKAETVAEPQSLTLKRQDSTLWMS